MRFRLNQTYRTWYALPLVALISLKSFSQTNESIEDPVSLQPPENWYQAEVILFTQQGNIRGESAPKNYQLEFPENWLELIDPQQITVENEVDPNTIMAEQDDESTLQSYLLSNENNRDFEPNDYLIPEASIPYQDSTVVEASDNSQNLQEKPFIPVYEEPFLLLNAPVRDLNQSASALDRRGYNVLFHEAWRFQITAPESAPWIIIKAGPTDTERFHLEGSIRFYQSRFLHFETNLWRLKFSDSATVPLSLPAFPMKDESHANNEGFLTEEVAENTPYFLQEGDGYPLPLPVPSHFSQTPTESKDDNTTAQQTLDKVPDEEEFESDNKALADTANETATDEPDSFSISEYPVEAVWVMNKSQRLQETEVYYLDHPEMGVLVTIKSYEPELLNPPIEPALAIETLNELIAEPSP